MKANSRDPILDDPRYREMLRNFRLLDDDFMSKVFEDKDCAQLLLRIILKQDDLVVKSVKSQENIKNLWGRSVRLDIFATDESGKYYNVEIQRSDKGADARRARYNSSLIDANITRSGDHYEDLHETFVIFITERDVLGAGCAAYHIDRTVKETGNSFNDGSHIIYVNAQHKSNSPLGKLMQDFSCTNADDMHYPVLAERVRYFKEDQEGATHMCRSVEKMINQARIEANAETVQRFMSQHSLSVDEALKILVMPEAEWDDIRKYIETHTV